MTNDFNDSLDDIFGIPTADRQVEVRPAAQAYLAKVAEQPNFFQKCGRCQGTGQTPWGTCFRCRGAKGKTFKTSPETREANRQKAVARKARSDEQTLADFAKANPAEHAWLVTTAPRWEVARSLLAAVVQYGSLTDRQLGVVRNGIARDATFAANKATHAAAKAADAPAVDTAGVDRLKASFDQAVAYSAAKGLKLSPRITIGGMTISPAKANSANPGALYIKSAGIYLGKVAGGRFFASRECTGQQEADVARFIADPAEAAKVYGQTTGTCCICNATLRSDWKHKGIGPICAEKFGW